MKIGLVTTWRMFHCKEYELGVSRRVIGIGPVRIWWRV